VTDQPAGPGQTGVPEFQAPELKNAGSEPSSGPSTTGVPEFQASELKNAGLGGGGGRRGGLTRRGRVVLGGLAVLLVVGAGAGLWLFRQVNPAGGPGAEVAVDVEPGTSVAGVAARLEAKGVVHSARIFRIYLKLTGGAGTIQAGEYELRKNLSMGTAKAALKQGPSIKFLKLTIPEGLTLDQIGDRVGALPGRSKDRFLAAARSGTVRSKYQPPGSPSLEGLLFPDTYLVTDKEDDAAILRRLVSRFDAVADEVGLGAVKPAGLGAYQVIVGASLVESEAKVPEDRPLIASVIANRLQKGMKLQIDATVLYALGEHKDRVLNRDLEIDSPYNTYKVDGLPPTPISAPGRASLEAMLHPADSTYLYYVLSDKNGKHAFATTPAEFEALKAEAHRKGLL
jgi:UPF0755 protein